MNRQRKILIGLIIALTLAIASAWFRMPDQQRVVGTVSPRVSGAAVPSTAAADVAQRLHVELLDRSTQRFSPPNRDLFNFVEPPPPKPKKAAVAVAPPPPPPPPPQPAPEMIRRIEVRRALARFTFLGYLLKDQRRTVFLSQGESLFLVQEGDKFGDNDMFHAVSITPEKMTISQTGNPGVIEIQLVEQAPLVPTFDDRDTLPAGNKVNVPGSGVPLPVLPASPPAFTPGNRRTFNAGPRGESIP